MRKAKTKVAVRLSPNRSSIRAPLSDDAVADGNGVEAVFGSKVLKATVFLLIYLPIIYPFLYPQ